MDDMKRALQLFERIVSEYSYPCALERRRPLGVGDPSEYAICIKAKNFTGRELHEVSSFASKENLELGIMVSEASPYLVLR